MLQDPPLDDDMDAPMVHEHVVKPDISRVDVEGESIFKSCSVKKEFYPN